MIRAAAITVSDKGYSGERDDLSGPLLRRALESLGFAVEWTVIIPDDLAAIEAALREGADERSLDLVMTTGGTGFAPRDVTPEATVAVADRLAPGLAELVRAEGLKETPLAVLSRGVAVIRKRTLIINLAGSPNAVQEGMKALAPVLPHAIEMLRGENLEHSNIERCKDG